MSTYENQELGIAIDIKEDGSATTRSTRPRYESMMSDERCQEWFDNTYDNHEINKNRDFSI